MTRSGCTNPNGGGRGVCGGRGRDEKGRGDEVREGGGTFALVEMLGLLGVELRLEVLAGVVFNAALKT